jgi:hypothetical protein
VPLSAQAYAGQRITGTIERMAAGVTAWKTSQTSVTSSTTLAPDPDLSVPVVASATYLFELVLMNCSGGAAGALKLNFAVPSGAAGDYLDLGNNTSGTDSIIDAGALTTVTPNNCNAGVLVKGLIVVSTTAGNLTLQWAQNSSNATATVVGVNSYLTARQVG